MENSSMPSQASTERSTGWPPHRPGPWGPHSPGPWWPWPTPWPEGDLLYLPLAAGEIHGKALRAALTRFEEVGRNKRQFMRNGAEKLAIQGNISTAELQHIFELIDLVIEIDKKPSNTSAVTKVRNIHQMLVDHSASPIALIMSSIALDSSGNVEARGPIASADLDGAITGALIGFEIGLVPGAIAGAIIGAILFSLAAAL